MKKLNKKAKGFTLTELVIVIVIIAILAAVLIPSMTGYVNRAKKSNATQEAATMYNVYAAWLVDETDKYGYDADAVTIYASGVKFDATYTNCAENDAYSPSTTYYLVSDKSVATPSSTEFSANKTNYCTLKHVAVAKDSTINRSTTQAEDITTTAKSLNQFAAYVCEAQDATITAVTTDGVTLSTKQILTAASDSGFTMVSSNKFTVKVTITNGVPSYEVSEKANA